VGDFDRHLLMDPFIAPGAGSLLRVVTLNTWKCDGAYRQRLHAMATQLRALNPDVVALQESFASVDGRWDTARHLAQAMGMGWVQVPARTKARVCEGVAVASHSGMALLSRWPIAQHTSMDLPNDPEDGERVALLCQLVVDSHRLTVANVHLTHLPAASALRHRQLHAVLEHPWLHSLRQAAIVCGDFNAPLHADGLCEFVVPLGVWVDVARTAGTPHKVTCPVAHGAGLDLDHVLARAGSPLRWHSAHVALDHVDPIHGVWPSDHHALCVDGHWLP